MRLRLGLFPADQPGPKRRGVAGGGFAGGLAQRLGTHHDALAVHRDHQQGVGGARGRHALLVEGVDISRGRLHQCFGLPLAGHRAAPAPDRLTGGVERAAHGLGHRQPADPMAVSADRQAQAGIGGVDVGPSRGAQCAPAHGHRADHGGQHPVVAALDTAAAGGPLTPAEAAGQVGLLPHRPQVQMVPRQLL